MTKIYSIYSDGNYFPRAKKSGFGGYIESPEGDILVEYTEQIKQPHYIHNFELLGIIRGLQLAQTMGLKHVISYCDDKTTMLRMTEIMANGGSITHLPAHAKPELFAEIVKLSQQFESSKFQYIPRTQNKHSDSLSRRYATLMEQNFLRQYEEELVFSEQCFQNQAKPAKKIFFSHPNLVKIKEKNNPFLVAPVRNRKARKMSKQQQENPYQYLFIESIPTIPVTLKAFYYQEAGKQELLSSLQLSENNHISEYCDFLQQNLEEIKSIQAKNTSLNQSVDNNVWIYSNYPLINKYLEQKEKIPKDSFNSFSQLFQSLNHFSNVMMHGLPFKHEFSPEIAIQEEKKSTLHNDIETIDSLMEQLQSGALGREHNKYFGKLIRYQLRNYKNLLSRELNDVEKQQIIEQTTQALQEQNIQKISKIRIK